MTITPFSYLTIIVILTDADSIILSKEDGYYADIDILADESSGHYSLFTTDPYPVYHGESDGNLRYLYWSSTDATWYISGYLNDEIDDNPCDTDRIFSKCKQPVLSQCNEDKSSTITISSIRYCITIQETTSFYHINGTDSYNHHMFISSDNDHVLWYDTNESLWKVTDELNGDKSYANCSKSNIFDCNTTFDPLSSSFDINKCDTIQPTMKPSRSPTIEPTTSPVIVSRLLIAAPYFVTSASTVFATVSDIPSIISVSTTLVSNIPSTTQQPTYRPTMKDMSIQTDPAMTTQSGQMPEEIIGTDISVAIEETKVVTSGSKSNTTTLKTHHLMFYVLVIVVISVLCGILFTTLIRGCCIWCKRKPVPKPYRKITPKPNKKIKQTIELENNTKAQPDLTDSHNLNILVDVKDYTQWSMQEVATWIFGLENGRYQKYIHQLIKGFKNDGITASDLPELDQADLRSFGMMTFHDRRDLKQHFQSLKSGPFPPGIPELDERISDQLVVVDDNDEWEEEESKEMEFSEGVRKYPFKQIRMTTLEIGQILEEDEEILGDDQLSEGMSVYTE